MQEVAKAAGLVAVAAFLLWKVACRVKRGRNKQSPSEAASPLLQGAQPTSSPQALQHKPKHEGEDSHHHDDQRLEDDGALIRVPDVSPPRRPSLFMRVPSTRSLHSSPSIERDDTATDELPRLGTAQAPPPADGQAPPQMPTAYSMSDSLPSGSQLGIKLGSRTLSSLFRDGSEGGRVEQNYWSLDDDAASASSGESSVNSPSNMHVVYETGTARAGADAGGDPHVVADAHVVFPAATTSPHAAAAVAANPFLTESPFLLKEGSLGVVTTRTDSTTSGAGGVNGGLLIKPSASSQSSTTTTGGAGGGSGLDSTAGGGSSSGGGGAGGGGGGGPRRTLSGGSKRSRQVLEQPCLAIELQVTEGPCRGVSYHADDTTTQITIGRLDANTLTIADQEVSGMHLRVEWDAENMSWKVADLGSLNGSLLNSYSISKAYRQPGDAYRLRNGDVLQLGSATKLTVTYAARDLLPHDVHAAPLVVPDKPRPSASDTSSASVVGAGGNGRGHGNGGPATALRSGATLVQPKSAACLGELFTCAGLGLEGAGCQQTGVEHARRNQACEDVWLQLCPLPTSPVPAALVCVCDGHTGIAAAIQVKAHLPQQLQAALPAHQQAMRAGTSLAGMWASVFAGVDEVVKTDEGCTGTVALVWRSDGGDVCVQVANVGDSTALCVELPEEACDTVATPMAAPTMYNENTSTTNTTVDDNDGARNDTRNDEKQQAIDEDNQGEGDNENKDEGQYTSTPHAHHQPHEALLQAHDAHVHPKEQQQQHAVYQELTCAHRPCNPVERQRLAALGVHVGRDGRLYGLNLSRGFGDSCLKEQDLGMIAEPHVSPVVHVPRGGSLLLLVASDGLWDVASHERAVEVALDAYHASFGNVRLVAQTLVEHAQKQRSKDDITVLAVTITNS